MVTGYRRYQRGDFESLYAIEEICFQARLRFSRSYMRGLIRSHQSATWIAVREQALAGFAIVEWALTTVGMRAYIPTIEVHPASRGQGIGAELLRHLEASAHEAEAESIWLHVDIDNAAAIGLYEAHGFARAGQQAGFYGAGHDAFIYSKSLQSKLPGTP